VSVEGELNTITLESVNCIICDCDEAAHLFSKDLLAIVKCKRCGLRYVNPRASASHLEANYVQDYYPPEKLSRIHNNAMEWLQMAERLAEIERHVSTRGKLLDVGCGIGTFLRLAKDKGWETYGVDPSESGAAFAREQHGLNVFCGDLFEANFPDQYFDVITLYHVLEHIPHPNPLLKELRRILKPKTGCLVIEVPNGGGIQSRLQKENWPYVHPRDHLYYFSCKTLPKFLRKHGFNQIRIGKPRRVNPNKGVFNAAKFVVRRSITTVLVRLHLAAALRVYAGYNCKEWMRVG
jgi:2-polyprenyl-3-methyl-5-hydroxy-6-metoxy-1,4-benzoquinol methylase